MKKTAILVSTTGLIIASLLSISAVSAHGDLMNDYSKKGARMESHGVGHGKNLKRLSRYLGLTNEQKETIKFLRSENQDNRAEIKTQMMDFKTEMKALMQEEVFDEQAFESLYLANQDTFKAMALLKAKSKHSMYQVLTDEQKEKVKAFKGRAQGLF